MTTADDILGARPGRLSDYEGKEIMVESVTWKEGQHGEYATLVIACEGAEETISTGSVAVLDKLRLLEKDGLIPFRCVVESYPTKWGNKGFDLKPPPDAPTSLPT